MNGKLSHPKMYICASARDLALYIEQQRIYCYIPVGVLPDRFMVENLIFPPPEPAVLNRLFLFGGHRVNNYIEREKGNPNRILLVLFTSFGNNADRISSRSFERSQN